MEQSNWRSFKLKKMKIQNGFLKNKNFKLKMEEEKRTMNHCWTNRGYNGARLLELPLLDVDDRLICCRLVACHHCLLSCCTSSMSLVSHLFILVLLHVVVANGHQLLYGSHFSSLISRILALDSCLPSLRVTSLTG